MVLTFQLYLDRFPILTINSQRETTKDEEKFQSFHVIGSHATAGGILFLPVDIASRVTPCQFFLHYLLHYLFHKNRR